jgi:hypothetical protein
MTAVNQDSLPTVHRPLPAVHSPSLALIWLILPTLLTLAYVGTLVQYPLDFWYHVATGRLIWQSGAIPVRDTFTFTIAGQPVINQCWLAQLGMYGLFTWGGFALAQFVAAMCYAAALAVTTAIAWHRSGNARIAAAVTLGALGLAMSNFGVRPQALSFFLFAVELMVLWRWPHRWATVAIVALVEVLWTNIHGAFPLGIVLPGIFLVGAGWTLWRHEGFPAVCESPAVRGYAVCLLIAAICAFCNPHPGRTLDYVLGVGTTARVRGIGEWAPSRLDSYTGIALLVSVVFAAAILALRWRRVTATDLVLLVPFAALAFQHQRMVAWWAVVLASVIAHHLGELLRRQCKAGGESPPLATVTQEEGSLFNGVLLILLLAWAAMSTPWTRSYNPILGPGKRAALADDDPRAGLDYLCRSDCQGNVFAPLEWGGYLTWFLSDRVWVFMDGRIDFFPEPVWREYLQVALAEPGWESVLSRHKITWVVWSKQMCGELPSRLSGVSGWEKVYEDELVLIWARRDMLHPHGGDGRKHL